MFKVRTLVTVVEQVVQLPRRPGRPFTGCYWNRSFDLREGVPAWHRLAHFNRGMALTSNPGTLTEGAAADVQAPQPVRTEVKAVEGECKEMLAAVTTTSQQLNAIMNVSEVSLSKLWI